MPFVFLRLLGDEEPASPERNPGPESRHAGARFGGEFRKGVETKIASEARTAFPSVQVERVTTPADDSQGQISALSTQLEELRRKVSGSGPQPYASRVVNNGVPTFGT